MQLNQFEYLVAVDRYGSISRVAQELYVSQSTVSVALINLEKELGISILQRGKRGVTFTPEGAIVLDKAKIIMEQVNALKSAKINENDFGGEIKIGSSTHFGMSIITDVIIQIKKQYPKIALFTKRSYVKEIIKAVSLKELDIGLIMYNSLNELDIKTELKRNSLDFTEFFQDRQSICVGADHPLLEKEEVYVADLLPYDFISLHKIDNFMYLYFQSKGYEKIPISVNDVDNGRRCVSMLNGFMLMPNMELEKSNKTYHSKLYSLNVIDFDVRTYVGWIHQNNNMLSVIEEIIINQLEEGCQRYVDTYMESIKQ